MNDDEQESMEELDGGAPDCGDPIVDGADCPGDFEEPLTAGESGEEEDTDSGEEEADDAGMNDGSEAEEERTSPAVSEGAGAESGEENPVAAAEEKEGGELPAEGEEAPAGEGAEAAAEEESGLTISSIVEALLIGSSEPQTAKSLAKAVKRRVNATAVKEAIESLNAFYLQSERAFEIVQIGEYYQIMTLPEFALHLNPDADKGADSRKLSPASLDTLAIVAYRQPILRVEVERIRGVGCGQVLRSLMELGLTRVVGKNTEVLGHPALYGTTERFLEVFGLSSLDDLPNVDQLRAPS